MPLLTASAASASAAGAEAARGALHLQPLIDGAGRWLPLYTQGFGWVCPALAGLAVGLLVRRLRRAA